MDMKVVKEPESWVGKKVHVKGWNPASVFVLESHCNGESVLRTPMRGRRYTTKNDLLYTRSDQYLMEREREKEGRTKGLMSFTEFSASRVEGNQGRFEEFGLESFFDEGSDGVRDLYVYADVGFILVLNNGQFHLIIGASEWLDDDIEALEEILYNEWYAPMFAD